MTNAIISVSQFVHVPLGGRQITNPRTGKIMKGEEYLFYDGFIKVNQNDFESSGSYLGTNAIIITKQS